MKVTESWPGSHTGSRVRAFRELCVTLLFLSLLFGAGSMLTGCESFKKNIQGAEDNISTKAPPVIYPSPMEDPQNYPYK